MIRDKDVVKKLFDEIGARFTDRQGGYTRIVKTGFRAGDSATMAIIELVARPAAAKKEKKDTKAKKETKTKVAPKAKKEPKVKKEAKPKAAKVEKEARPKKAATKKAKAKKEE